MISRMAKLIHEMEITKTVFETTRNTMLNLCNEKDVANHDGQVEMLERCIEEAQKMLKEEEIKSSINDPEVTDTTMGREFVSLFEMETNETIYFMDRAGALEYLNSGYCLDDDEYYYHLEGDSFDVSNADNEVIARITKVVAFTTVRYIG